MEIQTLTSDHADEIADLYLDAFLTYPMMKYVLGEGGTYSARLRRLLRFWIDIYIGCGWPVVGVVDAGEVVAAALVTPPSTVTDEEVLAPLVASLRDDIGSDSVGRLERFEQLSEAGLPDEPHHFLGILGVRESHQGRGLGSRLLSEVVEMAASDRLSQGVCLTTEVPENVDYYKRHGFVTISEVQVHGVPSWCMKRRVVRNQE